MEIIVGQTEIQIQFVAPSDSRKSKQICSRLDSVSKQPNILEYGFVRGTRPSSYLHISFLKTKNKYL